MVAKKKSHKKSQEDSIGTCFTIMPFGGWFDQYYIDVFVPAIENSNLRAVRADDLYKPSTIVTDIWSLTKTSKLVLADLTGKNPNVFYELGLAHAIGKPVVLTVETMEDVPFDLRALRILEYDKNAPNWGEQLKRKVELSIQEVLLDPAQSVPTAFLEVGESPERPDVSETEKEIIELQQQMRLLKKQLNSTERVPNQKVIDDLQQQLALLNNRVRLSESISGEYFRRIQGMESNSDIKSPKNSTARRIDDHPGTVPNTPTFHGKTK